MIILEKTTLEFNKAKDLYKEVFCDNDSFIETIMKSVIVASVDIENNEVVSCAFAREKQIKIEGRIINVPFLFGVATKKEYRKQNRASKILCELVDFLEQKYDFVLLCPANKNLYDFYSKFGFEKLCFFDYKTKEVSKDVELVDGDESDAQMLANIFNEFNQKNKIVQYRTKENMQIKIEEILSDNGKIKIVRENNKKTGYFLFDEMILEAINVDFFESSNGPIVVELSDSQKEVDKCPGIVVKKFKDVNLEQIKFYEMW